jgi:hypothetical protein
MHPLIRQLPDHNASSATTQSSAPPVTQPHKPFSWSETPTQAEDDFFKTQSSQPLAVNSESPRPTRQSGTR